MFWDDAFEPQPPVAPAQRPQDHDSARWQPLLSVDEERELAERIKAGDQAARRQLILANLRLVAGIARRYKGSKIPLDDLVQEGNLGLIRASEDFDPSAHGCRFYTYAEIWIKAFVHRALVGNESLIRVPDHVFRLRKKYRRVAAALGDAGRGGDGRGESEPVTVEEVVPLSETIVDNRVPDQDVADHEQRLLLEVALRRLNPFEAWVIRERYGLGSLIAEESGWSIPTPHAARGNDPRLAPEPRANPSGTRRTYFHRSYPELERDCGLSRHRIRQVEQFALEKLREVLGPCLLQAV